MFSQGLGADNGLLFNNGVLITDNRNLFFFFFRRITRIGCLVTFLLSENP